MIGPKIFTDEEKEAIQNDCARLESRLDSIDIHARNLSVSHNLAFDEMVLEFERALEALGYSGIIRPEADHMHFSAISPDILFKFFAGVKPVSQAAARRAEEMNLSSRVEGGLVFKEFRKRFREFSASWARLVSRWHEKQFGIYQEILGNTMVEMPFEQPNPEGPVFLYVVDPDHLLLRRYESHVDNALFDYTGPSLIIREAAFGKEAVDTYRREAKHGNVYVVSNFSRVIDPFAAAVHVHRGLRNRWKKESEAFLNEINRISAMSQEEMALEVGDKDEHPGDYALRPVYFSIGGEIPDDVIESMAAYTCGDDTHLN